ncbi:hypothetical protein [Rhizobium anhuiense]|uniref:hypothetical protein n=1 Tax=Rhizobium anhuiense TaxID=1184720 RepID=UPI00117B5546|nr:hypothetical protein [Rhizobium anhuiense]
MDQSENKINEGILGYKISELGITEILLRDFDHSWEYYKFNLEERRDIIARIYNFIGFPAFGISIILYLIDNNFIGYSGNVTATTAYTSTLAGAIICLVLSIYGLLQLIALANESRVSRDYLNFLNNVRNYIGLNSLELRPFLKFNHYEIQMRAFLHSGALAPFRNGPYNAAAAQAVENTLISPGKNEDAGFVFNYIRSLKGIYWRSSSAIFIVSVSISLTLVLTLYTIGSYSGIDVLHNTLILLCSGLVLAFSAFVLVSNIFLKIADVR